MATYYALTTENSRMLGWHILAEATTRDEARRRAHEALGPVRVGDIHDDTYRANLRIVSRTAAIRRFGLRHRLACGCCNAE